MSATTIRDAGSRTILFGKFQGLTISEVADTSHGCEYLRSLLSERAVGAPLKNAIRVFLKIDPDAKT